MSNELSMRPRLRLDRWWAALRGARTMLAATPARVVVVIRPAREGDGARIDRLGQLDGREPASARYLVAEIDGELVAAVPLGEGDAMADPFRPTQDIVSLLEHRAAQLAA